MPDSKSLGLGLLLGNKKASFSKHMMATTDTVSAPQRLCRAPAVHSSAKIDP